MNFTSHALVVPCEGFERSGDTYLIRKVGEGGLEMVAVVDALGHGEGAAEVADAAVEHLSRAPVGPAEAMVDDLHGALRGTRGAAAMLCVFQGAKIEACGVGNVDLRASGTRIPVVLSPGILGVQVRRYRSFEARLNPGTRIVIFSDGISARFEMADFATSSPETACREITQKYRRAHDDSTVLVLDVT